VADISASPTLAPRGIPIRAFTHFCLATILVLDALEGYTIGGMPLPWIGMAMAIPVMIVTSAHQRLRAPPGTAVYLVLLLWLFGNTSVASMLGPYADMHPSTATTPYPVFVLLRAYSFLGYLLLMVIIYTYAQTEERQRLVDFIIMLGVVMTAYATYVFIAQRYGLPVPRKTRYGTGEAGAQAGGDSGEFGDGNERYFARLAGSFREPSFLAVWLIVPFFLSLTRGRRLINWRTAVLGFGLLGTGSLTTAVAIPIALLLALVFMNPFRKQSLIILLSIGGTVGLVLYGLDLATRTLIPGSENFGFMSQFTIRLERVMEGGIGASNRGYAYEKLFDSDFSLEGIGLGNCHIYYSRGAATPVSFLSLYIHMWFAGGAIGLALLVVYLLTPLALLMLRHGVRERETVWLVAAHICWLIVYFVNAESFSVMPAVSTALLMAHLMQAPARRAA
jgi:hypothetical protein